MPGNPLHAEVTADSGDYVASMETAVQSSERLGDQAIDTSGALQILQNRADEAGDQVRGAGRSATMASVQFGSLNLSSLSLSSGLAAVTASATSTTAALAALATTLLPLTAVVGTLTAGLVSLGAVFGGLTIAGVVTHMDELKTALGDARDEIMRLIQPLGDVFGPLLVDAVEALPELVRRILAAIGPMDQFRDALVEFGQLAMDAIPRIVSGMVDFARIALPPFQRFVDYILANGQGAMQGMLRVTREIGPELMAFGEALVDALPELTELGTIILEVLLPALTRLTEFVEVGVGRFNEFVRENERLHESITTVSEALTEGIGSLEAYNEQSEVGEETSSILAEGLETVADAYEEHLGRASDVIDRHLGDIVGQTEAILGDIIGFWQSHSDTIMRIVDSAWTIISTVLIGGLDSILTFTNAFLAVLRGDWDKAWNEITSLFDRQMGRIQTIAENIGPLIISAIEMTINGLIAAFRHLVGIVVTNQDSLIKSLFRNAKSWIMNNGRSIIGGAFDAVVNLIQDRLSWLTGTGDNSLVGDIVSAFESIGGRLASIFQSAFSGLQSVVNDAMGLPWEIDLPSVTVAGNTYGGGTLRVPRFGGSGSATSTGYDIPAGTDLTPGIPGGEVPGDGPTRTMPWTPGAPDSAATSEAVIPRDRAGGMDSGATEDEIASAMKSADRTDAVVEELRRVQDGLKTVAEEAGTDVEFRDTDRWNASKR